MNRAGEPLVSIIIPTYNRGAILGETLESIIRQTVEDWECIVVDDGSNDDTEHLLLGFNQQDSRIRFFRRPANKIKGANSCRNLGFSKSVGHYIIWFDSDDLMTPDHVEIKLQALKATNSDFVVGKTANFEGNDQHEPYYYEKKDYGIKAADYILSKIHWYTYDVLLRREIAEKIKWNEEMKSWQDHNYFSKMLLETEKGHYIDSVLTHRRLHTDSIQRELNKDSRIFQHQMLKNRLLTYRDITDKIEEDTRREMVFAQMNHCFELLKLKKLPPQLPEVCRNVKNVLGKRTNAFFATSLILAFAFKKGFKLLEKAKGR